MLLIYSFLGGRRALTTNSPFFVEAPGQAGGGGHTYLGRVLRVWTCMDLYGEYRTRSLRTVNNVFILSSKASAFFITTTRGLVILCILYSDTKTQRR